MTSGSMHPLVGLLCMAASSVLYGLPFPPTDLQPLAWVALVPFLLAVRRSSPLMAAVVACGFAAFGAYATADGLPRSLSDYYDQPRAIGIGFFIALASITTSSVMVAFAFYCRAIVRLDVRMRPLLTAAAWVAYELVRARALGNPWAAFGYSQSGNEMLVQIADMTGQYGPSFVLAAVNAAIAEVLLAHDRPTRRATLWGAGLVALCLAGQLAYGWLRPRSIAYELTAPGTAVAIVQGNVDLGRQWRQEFYGETIELYMKLTAGLLREQPRSMVVWPENAMTFFIERESYHRDALGVLLSGSQTQLISGGPRSVKTDEQRYFNSAFLIEPDGQVVAHYDKQQLLPFAEYFPVPWLDFLRRDFGQVREFTPGADTPPLSTTAGRAGITICNESLFAEIVSRRVREGAELLVNLTNDGWLADQRLSGIAFAMTTLRAVEQRRYIIRASTSGPSAIIDPLGRAHGRTSLLERGTTAGEVRAMTARTIYSRIGDLFAVLCLLAAAAAAVRARSLKR